MVILCRVRSNFLIDKNALILKSLATKNRVIFVCLLSGRVHCVPEVKGRKVETQGMESSVVEG